MKRFLLLMPAIVFAYLSVVAQQASYQPGFDDAPVRANILKASIALHESDENLFWPLYEQYEIQLNSKKNNTNESLMELISNERSDAAMLSVQNLLNDQRDEATLKKEYFYKILNSTNGSVALQFLQGEALYDLLLKSKIYEKMHWSEPVWTPSLITDEKAKEAAFEFALGVDAGQVELFRSLLSDFEFEYSRVVGHEYVFFEHYIDNANGWTPGQCKKMGDSFIAMQLNEVNVKDRFFRKFHEAFGPSFAARFISLQEYFNMMAKLKVWSDYISAPD